MRIFHTAHSRISLGDFKKICDKEGAGETKCSDKAGFPSIELENIKLKGGDWIHHCMDVLSPFPHKTGLC